MTEVKYKENAALIIFHANDSHVVSLKLKRDGKQELNLQNVKHHGLAHNYHVLNTDCQSGDFRSNFRHQFFYFFLPW